MTTLLYSCHSKQDTRLVFRPEFRSAMPNLQDVGFQDDSSLPLAWNFLLSLKSGKHGLEGLKMAHYFLI
jgi:hypothetical protein